MGNSEERAEGAGPFTTRLTWRLEAGETAVWESRAARKRGTLAVRPAGATESSPRRAGAAALTRLRRLNGIAAGSFTFGGTLFALGAALAQFSAMSATGTATIYFVGGVFFTLGGYASLVQAINAPRRESAAASLTTHRFRWWSYEPGRIDWLSTFVLFAGTLVFGINLLDSFLQGLTVQQMNRLVWAPDLVGCLLFLISGQLAVVEVCHGGCASNGAVSGGGSSRSISSVRCSSWWPRWPPSPARRPEAWSASASPTGGPSPERSALRWPGCSRPSNIPDMRLAGTCVNVERTA